MPRGKRPNKGQTQRRHLDSIGEFEWRLRHPKKPNGQAYLDTISSIDVASVTRMDTDGHDRGSRDVVVDNKGKAIDVVVESLAVITPVKPKNIEQWFWSKDIPSVSKKRWIARRAREKQSAMVDAVLSSMYR